MAAPAGPQHDEQAGELVHDGAGPALDPNGPAVAPVHEVLRSATPVSGRAFGADPLGGTSAGDDVTEVLRRRQGRGDTLPTDVAQNLGEKLGTPLDDVRVHHDQEADGVARSMQATAFTFGTDIYFSRGTYDPHGKGGQHLLAHELAHVSQHRRGGGGGASSRAVRSSAVPTTRPRPRPTGSPPTSSPASPPPARPPSPTRCAAAATAMSSIARPATSSPSASRRRPSASRTAS